MSAFRYALVLVAGVSCVGCTGNSSSDSTGSPTSPTGTTGFTNARFESGSDICPATPVNRPISVLVDVENDNNSAFTIDPGIIVNLTVVSSSVLPAGTVYDGSGGIFTMPFTPSTIPAHSTATVRILQPERCVFNFLGANPNGFILLAGDLFIQGRAQGSTDYITGSLHLTNTFRLSGTTG